MYLIGLTGNIACGKSTVLAMLRELGAASIDADAVVHQLQSPGTAVYAAIAAAFPFAVPAPGAPLDRRALGALVFQDQEALRRLEAIVLPAVRAEIVAWVAAQRERYAREGQPAVAVIDAVLLLERGYEAIVDAVWVVSCREEQQLERLVGTRGMSVDEARRRIGAQTPQRVKIARAHVVIDNSGTVEATRAQVQAAWQSIARR